MSVSQDLAVTPGKGGTERPRHLPAIDTSLGDTSLGDTSLGDTSLGGTSPDIMNIRDNVVPHCGFQG